MDHLIDKYLKKPEVVKDLFTKNLSISLKVDGAAFQISYNKENDSITYHKRGGSSKSLGPIIDEYTRLMRKNINDAIDYFESKKDIIKKYKFYAIEMFNDSYILLTVIDNDNNIIDDRNKLKDIAKLLNIDCVPVLFEGKLNKEQIDSLMSMMTLEPETSNDTYKKYLTNIFGKGDYQKFLVGDEVEGIVLTWNIDGNIIQYKIINPAFKTRHDKEIKQGNEDYKKEIEEYINLYELIYETINKIGKYESDNWIKNLDTNFINMINNKEFKSKFDEIIKTLQPKFKDFFTLQINKASKEIQDIIKEHGDNMKFLYEKYLQVFFKQKKRNYFISKEFQLNVNNVIERLQSKNESINIKRNMKALSSYIMEKLVINKDLKFGKYNPDELNSDNEILYNSQDYDNDDDDSIAWEDCDNIIMSIDKKYDYFLMTSFKSLGNSKDLEKDLYAYSPCQENNDIHDLINIDPITKSKGLEVRLTGGHIEIDAVNSGSRATYYIYALSHEAYDEISAWFEGGDEEVESLDFLFKPGSILEITN